MKTRFALLTLVLLLAACQPAPTPPPPTATPVPSVTLTPSPIPTQTPIPPTATPIPPTPTLEPPSVAAQFLQDLTVTYYDPFDENLGWGMDIGVIKDGVLEVVGDSWRGLSLDTRDFSEGQGLILDVKYAAPGAQFEMLLDHGDWDTEGYRRFGIIMEKYPQSNLWRKNNPVAFNNLHGNFRPQADTWYSVLMAIGPDGEFLAVWWDPANPTQVIKYREKFGKDWAGLDWKFRIGGNYGTFWFDDLREVQFSGFKK